MRNKIWSALVATLLLTTTALAQENNDNRFDINRGVNISGWLSQTTLTGSARDNFMTQQEFNNLAQMGFDHVRLPVGEDQMFISRTGEKVTEVFNLIHKAIAWCREADMKVIVDFHTLHTNTESTIWTSDETQQKFINRWLVLADELKDYPNDLVAFELLNEPTAPSASKWNTLAAKLIAALREVQPERKLVVGSNDWENVNSFRYLTVPAGDKNIILSFHFYIPHPLTHYGADWTYMAGIETELQYPGELISDEAFNALTAAQQNSLRGYRGYYDVETLKGLMQQAVARAKELGGLQLYCGEFGCYKCDRQSKLNWLTDVVSLFNGFGIPASHWEYKQGFGFCNQQGEVTDQEVLDIITADGPRFEEEPEIEAPFVDNFETGSLLWNSQGTSALEVNIVDNPLRSGVNTSGHVLLLNKKSNSWEAAQRNIETLSFGPADGQYKYLHMKVLNEAAVPLRIKLYEGSTEYFVDYTFDGPVSEWRDMLFYVGQATTSAGAAVNSNITKIAVRPNTAGKVYVDDVYVSVTGQAATGIENVARPETAWPGVYSLTGARVSTSANYLRPGIYIIGGRKVIK